MEDESVWRSIQEQLVWWRLVLAESRRTWIVPAELEVRVRELVESRGMSHVITVQGSAHLPVNTWYVMDDQAIQAGMRESLQVASRQPRWIRLWGGGA